MKRLKGQQRIPLKKEIMKIICDYDAWDKNWTYKQIAKLIASNYRRRKKMCRCGCRRELKNCLIGKQNEK